MANAITHTDMAPALPHVRRIGIADIRDALRKGLDDFRALPSEAIFVSVLYPVVGLLLGRLMTSGDALPLLYPFVTGFALVGPFAAVGLYELSRRREQGLDSSWQHAFDVFRSPAKWSIFGLGVLLALIFLFWLGAAETIYAKTLGDTPLMSMSTFFNTILSTPAGWTLIIVGNAVGFLFAVLVLMISVVSFPLVVDKNVSPAVAIVTSVRAVLANPLVMALWGLIVAVSLAVGSIPFLFGLAVVLPVLGHATWHLYRKVVED
jgi:uncharacterized membrane protein